MIFDQSKKSHRIALVVIIFVVFAVVRELNRKSNQRDLIKEQQDYYAQNKKQTNLEQQIYEDNDYISDVEAKRVRADDTNLEELLSYYLEEEELIMELLVRNEEGALSAYEVDLLEEMVLELMFKVFDNEKIRLNSTNELFSGIMYIAENDQVLKEFSLNNGKLNGRVKFYYDSGDIRMNSLWKNGKLISIKCWDVIGNLEECPMVHL